MHFENKPVSALIIPVLVFSCSALVSLLIMRYSMIPQWEAWTANKTVLASYRNSISGENGSATLKKRLVENKDSLKIKYDDLMRETGGSRDLSGVLQMIIAKANAADIIHTAGSLPRWKCNHPSCKWTVLRSRPRKTDRLIYVRL